jgi:hypothetical protein
VPDWALIKVAKFFDSAFARAAKIEKGKNQWK